MRAFLPIIALLPTLVLAESPVRTPVSLVSLGQMLLALLFVVVLIVVCLWLLKRFNTLTFPSKSAIKVLASFPINARDRLVLVEVGRDQILIGLSPGRIQKLHVLSEPVAVDSTSSSNGSGFQSKLLAAIQGKLAVEDDRHV